MVPRGGPAERADRPPRLTRAVGGTLRRVIVVLGRPGLPPPASAIGGASLDIDGALGDEDRDDERTADTTAATPPLLTTPIAIAAAAAGARVEVVGSIGDDAAGDDVVVLLGRSGVGHAALLRDPGGRTPTPPALRGTTDAPEAPDAEAGSWPLSRLEAEDVELGLGYLVEYRVLVLAERLGPDAERVAIEAARFQGAAIVAIVPPGVAASDELVAAGTVFEAPPDAGTRFTDLVGGLAAALDRGTPLATAFS